jgi:hypothetical protein
VLNVAPEVAFGILVYIDPQALVEQYVQAQGWAQGIGKGEASRESMLHYVIPLLRSTDSRSVMYSGDQMAPDARKELP